MAFTVAANSLFFKINCDGSHSVYPVRKKLTTKLRVAPETATRPLKEATESGLVPYLKFKLNQKPVTKVQLPEEELEPGVQNRFCTHESARQLANTGEVEEHEPVKDGKEWISDENEECEKDGEGDNVAPDKRSHARRMPMGYGDVPKGQLDRYQLVKQGEFYGYWDDEFGYQKLISRDKEVVLEVIYALWRAGADSFHFPSFKHEETA